MKAVIVSLAILSPVAPAALAEPQQPAATQAAVRSVSSEAFARSAGGATLIDVREPAEWSATGMPKDAKGISISRTDFADAVLAAVGGDKSKPVAVICKSGARSTRAADQLAAAGFTNVTNVADGMIGREGVGPGWLAAKLPTKAYAPE